MCVCVCVVDLTRLTMNVSMTKSDECKEQRARVRARCSALTFSGLKSVKVADLVVKDTFNYNSVGSCVSLCARARLCVCVCAPAHMFHR